MASAQGVDVVVGTPGRIKDLITRGSLKLDAIRYDVRTATVLLPVLYMCEGLVMHGSLRLDASNPLLP